MQNKTLEQELASQLLKDRRIDRRWKTIRFFIRIVFWLIIAFMIFGLFGAILQHQKKAQLANFNPAKPYVALVRLSGTIMEGKAFSANRVIPILQRAFKDKKAKGIILEINSPGGSAVQASIIHDRIMALKKQYHKKVVVVGDDFLASGAYLAAVAADKIYVNRDTLTGSIGVLMSGFGFTNSLHKLGMTRRVFTAGSHKVRLDPFEKLKPNDVLKVKKVLNEAHQNFIDDVLQTRKPYLKGDRKELFSGDFWTGETAVKLGLADGIGNTWTVMKNVFHVSQYRLYQTRPNLLERFVGNIKTELGVRFGLLDNYPGIQA